MSHWFDRLAGWSAGGRDDGAEAGLTRRQAVLGAAGVGAAGLLASPLIPKAAAEPAGCDCARSVGKQYENEEKNLQRTYIDHGNGLLALATVPFYLIAHAGLVTGTYLNMQHNCGAFPDECDKGPSGKPPPKNKQPCIQLGGFRRRGDQCDPGSGGGAEVGGCAGGTSSCPTPGGGDLCCFGSDICCSGCCCIAEVGCGCCGE
jgi:hypothetical protein